MEGFLKKFTRSIKKGGGKAPAYHSSPTSVPV